MESEMKARVRMKRRKNPEKIVQIYEKKKKS